RVEFGQEPPGDRFAGAAVLALDGGIDKDGRGKMAHAAAKIEVAVDGQETSLVGDREGGNEAEGKAVAQLAVVAIPLDGADGADLVELLEDFLHGLIDEDAHRFDKRR